MLSVKEHWQSCSPKSIVAIAWCRTIQVMVYLSAKRRLRISVQLLSFSTWLVSFHPYFLSQGLLLHRLCCLIAYCWLSFFTHYLHAILQTINTWKSETDNRKWLGLSALVQHVCALHTKRVSNLFLCNVQKSVQLLNTRNCSTTRDRTQPVYTFLNWCDTEP